MLPPIAQALTIEPMPKINSQLPFPTDELEIISNRDSSNIKQHTTVRTKTEHVLWRVRAIVWGFERPNVDSFRIRTSRTLKSDTADLTAIMIELFELSGVDSLASNHITI